MLKNYVYQYLLPVLNRLVNADAAVLLLAHGARRITQGTTPTTACEVLFMHTTLQTA